MPWSIVKHGNKFQVISKTSGRVAGTHPSAAAARQQVKALYANVPDARPPGDKKDH